MPRLDYPLPTLWDLTQWLAGHLNNGTAKDWMRPLYDSPHRENAFNLALKLSDLPHAFVPVTDLNDDELGEFNSWASGIANAFIQPYCNAMEGKPNSPIHLSCSSGDLNNITITTKNAVSPTNRYGENQDGDKETVILNVKACNAYKARNHLLAALKLIDDHIKRFS